MVSKALKTALVASLLTGSAASNPFSRRRTATSEHNARAREKREEHRDKTMKEREGNQSKRTLKKQQKLAEQSFRHINDMEGMVQALERTDIKESLPFPNQLKRGDIVKYKGRDGPFRDEGRNYRSDAVEIIEVIKPATRGVPPQYLVANATAPGGGDGPGGAPILVNHADLDPAPLGRSTLGFLKEFKKLEKDIMHDKYKNQALDGTAFPGARVTRDYEGLVRDNPGMVMSPVWKGVYSANFDRQKKMDEQRERTVAASEKLDKATANVLAMRRAQPSRQVRLPQPGIIERIIPSIYSPAADARVDQGMSELATFNAALSARKKYNDELRRSREMEVETMVKTGRMMDFFDKEGMTKTGRSLVDARASADWAATAAVKAAAAAQKLHTERLDAQQSMSDYTALQKKKYGPRARMRSTRFANKQQERKATKKRARAEKNRLDTLKRQRADAKSRMDGDRMDAEEEADDDDADDDDNDDDIVDEDDVTVDGESPSASLLKKLLETIKEDYDDDGDDEHEFEINGDAPKEQLRSKLQTVVEKHSEAGRGKTRKKGRGKTRKRGRRCLRGGRSRKARRSRKVTKPGCDGRPPPPAKSCKECGYAFVPIGSGAICTACTKEGGDITHDNVCSLDPRVTCYKGKPLDCSTKARRSRKARRSSKARRSHS